MREILLASGNAHKLEEFQEILKPLGYDVRSLKDMNITMDVDETEDTFEGNAILKVKALLPHYQGSIISDDSGISIAALDGGPGVMSARFMGEKTSYELKNQFIVDQVKASDDKSAYYTCAIAYYDGKQIHVFKGEMHGTIASERRGNHGFGYDPIFIPEGYQTTLAEMTSDKKNAISHRKKALDQLVEYMKKENQDD